MNTCSKHRARVAKMNDVCCKYILIVEECDETPIRYLLLDLILRRVCFFRLRYID